MDAYQISVGKVTKVSHKSYTDITCRPFSTQNGRAKVLILTIGIIPHRNNGSSPQLLVLMYYEADILYSNFGFGEYSVEIRRRHDQDVKISWRIYHTFRNVRA